MPDYRETTALGKFWTRCFRLIIDNPLWALGGIRFFEENVATLDDKVVKSESGNCYAVFDPNGNINLRDPETGQLTGAYIPQALLYQALYSVYIDTAEKRDAADGGVTTDVTTQFVAPPQ